MRGFSHWPVVNPCTCWQDYILCSVDHTYANSPSSSQNIERLAASICPGEKMLPFPRGDRIAECLIARTFFRSAPRHRVAGGADLFETCPTSQKKTSSVSKQPQTRASPRPLRFFPRATQPVPIWKNVPPCVRERGSCCRS